MSIGRNRSKSASHTIAESIAELVRELSEEALEPLRDDYVLARGNLALAQPDLAMWWRCSRDPGTNPWSRYASSLSHSAPGSARHPHRRRRSSV
jgi:hypothetical protein